MEAHLNGSPPKRGNCCVFLPLPNPKILEHLIQVILEGRREYAPVFGTIFSSAQNQENAYQDDGDSRRHNPYHEQGMPRLPAQQEYQPGGGQGEG